MTKYNRMRESMMHQLRAQDAEKRRQLQYIHDLLARWNYVDYYLFVTEKVEPMKIIGSLMCQTHLI